MKYHQATSPFLAKAQSGTEGAKEIKTVDCEVEFGILECGGFRGNWKI